MRWGLLGLLGLLGLSGCATVTQGSAPLRSQLRDFAIEARFALRTRSPGQEEQRSGGRISWEHGNGQERILIANPIGIGLAEIESNPAHSRLKTGDGRILESDDPEELLEQATGQRLPVARLPAWLLGRPGPDGRLERDGDGRPVRLIEAGWEIDYLYDDLAPDSPPARLNLRHGDDIELRLRIETWKDQP